MTGQKGRFFVVEKNSLVLDKVAQANVTEVDTEFAETKVTGNYQSFWQLMMVLVGFTFFSPSMLAGGQLGVSLTAKNFIIAILLGNLFLAVYTGVLAYIGQRTGLNLDLLNRKAFGTRGAAIPSLLMGVTQTGWFGVGIAMIAIPLSKLMGLNSYVLVIIFGVMMTITAIKGMEALKIFSSFAVPLILILGFYSVYLSVNEANGLGNVFSDTPMNSLTLTQALSIVIGNFISGGTTTPNFTRFGKTAQQAIWATVVAFFIGNIVMFVFGAVGASVYGVADIFDVLMIQNLTLLAIITLTLNVWSTNNNALYTSGLAITSLTKVPLKLTTILSGTIGTVFAISLYDHFVSYLNILGVIIPPVGMVLIIDYFFNKQAYQTDVNIKSWNMPALVAVATGVIVSLLLPVGISAVNSLVVSGLVYGVLQVLNKRGNNEC